jgi:hypothetical protein
MTAAVADYARLRRRAAARYEASPLDDLLRGLSAERRAARPLDLRDLSLAVRLAERVAPRLATGPNTCLFRGLARFALLSRHGHTPTFVLGAAEGLARAGHAWAEVQGEPFLEPKPHGLAHVLRYAAPPCPR